MLTGSARLWRLWDLMQQFDAGRVAGALEGLVAWLKQMKLPDKPAPHERPWVVHLDSDQLGSWVRDAEYLAQELVKAGAHLSAERARHLLGLLNGEEAPPPTNSPIMVTGKYFHLKDLAAAKDATEELTRIAPRELSSKIVFMISPERNHLLTDRALFGEKVAEVFDDTADDIEEAAKCLALGRSTACVFHLMRAAEGAAAIVSKRLGGRTHKEETGEALTFGGLFNEVKGRVEAIPGRPEKDRWLTLVGFMRDLNRGTRTKVDHPGTWYQESKAEDIFGLTKSFMREAAELLGAGPTH